MANENRSRLSRRVEGDEAIIGTPVRGKNGKLVRW